MKLLIISLLSATILSCGFHFPNKNSNIDAYIISENLEFSNIIKQHLDEKADKVFSIKVTKISKTKHNTSYKNNLATSYTLNINIDIIVSEGDNILFKKTFNSNRHLQNFDSQESKLQDNDAYVDMQNSIAKQILLKVKRL